MLLSCGCTNRPSRLNSPKDWSIILNMSALKRSPRNVRSPRSTAAMVKHLPSAVAALLQSGKGPAKLTKVDTPDGVKAVPLADWLWDKSQVQAQAALDTDFIQGIKSGLLDPTNYGGYTVQDAVYCDNATDYFGIAEMKACDKELKEFIAARIKSYAEYTEIMFKEWYIKHPKGIAMGDAAASYSKFELGVATKEEPFYLLIAMLPCEKLWGWLAQEIKSGINDTNVYSFWIQDNLPGSHTLANYIDENAENFKVDLKKAMKIYKDGMQCEVDFFTSGTIEEVN
eukprot:XP_003730066.1 PREDICTED: uncharacterized protein LOC764526 isoform X1 [Strongylocentrotus purpuratus]